MLSPAITFARQQQQRFLDELKDFLRIPSISTQSCHLDDIHRAADFVATELRRIGLQQVGLIKGGGNPIVYGEWLGAPGKPTLLCYGHYDVQPPDPLEQWIDPPFEPSVRNGNIYARGAADDKGQFHAQLKAIEALLTAGRGKLPVNLRVLVEGEEEIGGRSMTEHLKKHAANLGSNCALISDTEMFAAELPTLCVGLRGTVSTEVEIRGPKTDLHSGVFGGISPNPLVVLAAIINQLKDANGRISIPSFYDRIQQVDADELKSWARLPFDQDLLKTQVGARDFTGEAGYTLLERMWSRPTLDVHGIVGGYAGEGTKMVIPAQASAKVSMRLVPGQKADEIFLLYADYVRQVAPLNVDVNVRCYSKTDPMVMPRENRFTQAAVRALQRVFERAPVFVRSGGSIPVVNDIANYLKIPCVLMGFGLPDANIHAPNENLRLNNYYRGIESIILFFEELGH